MLPLLGGAAAPRPPALLAPPGTGGEDSGDVRHRGTPPEALLRVTLLAGGGSGVGWEDGPALKARFHSPAWVAAGEDGALYLSDTTNHTIRRWTPDGTVATLAGSPGQPGAADGKGTRARFAFPAGIAVSAGNVYVADAGNGTIRKIAPDGSVTTLAGKAGEHGHADGRGARARFMRPEGLAADSWGTLYVADSRAHVIRTVDGSGTVTTLAGSPANPGNADGQGAEARFRRPRGLAVDAGGHVYVADSGNGSLRQVDPSGSVATRAGADAGFEIPWGVALVPGEGSAVLYVSDLHAHALRSLDLGSFRVSPLAGVPQEEGCLDGPPATARFNGPAGLAFLPSGDLVIADRDNHLIRRMVPGGEVATLAGSAPARGWKDGPGSEARFNFPGAAVRDAAGNLYVADTENQVIRLLDPSGMVTTLAGTVGAPGAVDGPGGSARFDAPCALALDASGALLVADSGNGLVRKVAKDGTVSTFAGLRNRFGNQDGALDVATFDMPSALAFGPAGDLFVADAGSHTIRKISPQGQVTTLAGRAYAPGRQDGPRGDARFRAPSALAVDGSGLLWVGDSGNGALRTIDPSGKVATVAEGFKDPSALACLPGSTDLWVADPLAGLIQRVTPSGETRTLFARLAPGGSGTGSPSSPLDAPAGIAVTPQGELLVCGPHGVVRIVPRPEKDRATLAGGPDHGVVELKGLEPSTSTLRTWRSPS